MDRVLQYIQSDPCIMAPIYSGRDFITLAELTERYKLVAVSEELSHIGEYLDSMARACTFH